MLVFVTLLGTSCIKPESDPIPSLVAGYLVGSVAQSQTTLVASYYVSTNYAVTAFQAINFDSQIFDTNSTVTPGAANTWKFTAPSSGLYQFSGGVGTTTAANAGMLLYKNGASYISIGVVAGTLAASPFALSTTLVRLNQGDLISINPDQSINNFWRVRSNPI